MGDIRDPLEAERLLTVAPDAFETRRDFLKRTAVTAGLAAGMGLVLDPDTLVAEAARRQREVQLPSPRNLPIDTFVVLMMENRSFDHYLAGCPAPTGARPGCEFTDSHGPHVLHAPPADNFQGCGFLDPDHSWQGGRTEIDGGRMDGFLRAQSDVFSIGYYTQNDLPFTPHLAQAFTAFDRFFCSLLSSTYPNREYMHAGQSYGKMDNSLPSGGGFPDTTIFNALSAGRRLQPVLLHRHPGVGAVGRAGTGALKPGPDLLRARGRRHAARSVVRGPVVPGRGSGHLGRRASRTAMSASARRSSPTSCTRSWSRRSTSAGALFIVYDEWGGFFDHVVPPRVPDLRSSTDLNKDFGQMGLRIPAVVVSPYARRGHVDHSIYGFESILKMIRYRYGLPPLTPRDLYANNIAAAFDFESSELHARRPCLSRRRSSPRACRGSPPVDSGGTGVDDGGPIGSPPADRPRCRRHAERAKPHDLYNLVTSGYLERLHFHYRPATAGDHVPPPVQARDARVRTWVAARWRCWWRSLGCPPRWPPPTASPRSRSR